MFDGLTDLDRNKSDLPFIQGIYKTSHLLNYIQHFLSCFNSRFCLVSIESLCSEFPAFVIPGDYSFNQRISLTARRYGNFIVCKCRQIFVKRIIDHTDSFHKCIILSVPRGSLLVKVSVNFYLDTRKRLETEGERQ